MRGDSGTSISLWMETAEMPSQLALTADTSCDVCVIGAGMAGLTTAYLLTRERKDVVVLDDGPLAGGESCRTTAHLSNAIDDRYSRLLKIHGERWARLAAHSHTAAIERIVAIVSQENIACDFERLDGYLFVPPGGSLDVLDEELEATWKAGLSAVMRTERSPLPTYDTGPCLRFPAQGMFHPLRYLAGLCRAIGLAGGRIHTATHALTHFEGGGPITIETTNGPCVRCQAVVIATNAPAHSFLTIDASQAPYRTYVIGAKVPHGSVPRALYWDTQDPYHYVRLEPMRSAGAPVANYDVLIVGGEDHKTGQADDGDQRIARLVTWAQERFPMIQGIECRWSGQVMETMDGLAFIGRKSKEEPNIYVATGDSGMGMTHGTIAGMLLTDLIQGRQNPWEELYSPHRSRLHGLGAWISENLNAAAHYLDWVKAGQVEAMEQITPGSGAIMRHGLKKLAVYRDEHGGFHQFSATCPHMGCIVNWNSFEKTWDCPCHGSRFDVFGRTLNGPTNHSLQPAEESLPVSPRR